MTTRSDLYSKKGNNKFVKNADGSIYGYSEGGIQFICCGSTMAPNLLNVMDASDRAKLESDGEVVLKKDESKSE